MTSFPVSRFAFGNEETKCNTPHTSLETDRAY